MIQRSFAFEDSYGDYVHRVTTITCGKCGALLVTGVVGQPDLSREVQTVTIHTKWHEENK